MAKAKKLPPGIVERERTGEDGRKRPVYKASVRTVGGKQRSKTFDRLEDAKAWREDFAVAKRTGTAVDPQRGRMLYREWRAQWWKGATAGLRPSTEARDETYLRVHVDSYWGDRPLASIEQPHVVEWVSKLRTEPTERTRKTTGKPLAPATVRKVYQLFAASMEAAVTARYIGLSPCRDVPLPKAAREPMRFLTREEVARLADAIDPRYRALVFVLAYGGLRIGEAAALTTDRLDLAKRQLHVVQTVSWVKGHHHLHEPKTSAGRRKIGLPSLVAEELAAHLARLEAGEEFPLPEGRERKPYQRLGFAAEASQSGLVFPSLEGGYLQPTQFRARQFAPAVKAAGLDGLRVHDLRHTAVSFWIAQGADPKRIAARAGHASTSFTYDRYGNLFPDSEDDLMDRLDAFARGAGEDANVVAIR